MKLVLHHVPARRGMEWARQGWAVFRRAPLPLMALLATFLVGSLVLSLLGSVGSSLVMMAAPLLSLVFMLATHQVLQGRPLSFALWAHPFRVSHKRSATQVQLGLLFLVLAWMLMVAVSVVDGDAMDRLHAAMQAAGAGGQSPEAAKASQQAFLEALIQPALLEGALWRLLGTGLLSIPFWHAPALAHWGGHGLMQSLFGSCLGLWHNRAAFALHGLVWAGVALAAGTALALFMQAAPGLALALATPLSVLMGTVFYAGLYFSFVDSFRFTASRPAEPTDPADPAHPTPP